MAEYANFLILGLGSGAVFAALAMALVVTYRSSGVLNFAIGSQALYAAYTYALLRQGQLLQPIPGLQATISVGGPMGFWPALLITLVIQAIFGVVLYLVVFRPLRNKRSVAKAVASLGVASLLTALVNLQVGTQQLLADPIYPQHTYRIGSIRIPSDRLWLAVTIVAVALALAAFYRFTRFGLATRASAESEVGAFVSGLSPDRIALVNWAISAAVAGLAGILIAPLVPLVPGTYTFFIVPALAAAVVGQFSSLTPAVVAGLALGCLESVVVYLNVKYSWIPAGTSEAIPLVLVLVVLILRGKPLPSRGTLTQAHLGRAPRPHSLLAPLAVGVPVAVAAIFLLQHNLRSALISSFILGVISLSLVVVTGYVGQISLAQLTLAGVAGFSLSTIAHSWGVPFPIAPILAALVATAVGVVVGLPALRIRGLLIAVVTLTFAAAVEAFWFRNNNWNGGAGGAPVPTPRLFGIDLGVGSGKDFPRPEFGLLCLVVLVIVAVAVAKLRNSHLGSAMLAVRANERSAAAAGINVARIKLLGFAIGAFIAGIGGTLIAYRQSNVTFDSFAALLGLALFSTAYLAGITSVSGGIVAGLIGSGGLFFAWLNDLFNIGDWYGILAGAGVILTVILNPEGLVGPVHRRLDDRRRHARITPNEVPAVEGHVDLVDLDDQPDGIAVVTRGLVSVNGSTAAGAAASGQQPMLEVTGLTVRYGGVVAVNDLSFSVPAGRIVGLIGPNGSGKTTTMDALCGFTPCQGTVKLAGTDLGGLVPHRRAALGLGRTFQGIDLYEDLTVEENMAVGQHLAHQRGRDQVEAVLGAVGMDAYIDRQVAELSQGQRQLVSIARALAGQPRLLLLDEPAAGLDTSESQWLADRLRDVCDAGVTILLIDHDMSLVLGLCDVIHVLDFGAHIADGDPTAIRDNPRVAEAYLGASARPARPHHRAELAGSTATLVTSAGVAAKSDASLAVSSSSARAPAAPTHSPSNSTVAAPPALECRELSAGYDKLVVVRGFDVEVKRNEILVILGPNGAGKSTLLLTLAGFLNPAGGTIRVEGNEVRPGSARRMNRDGVVLVPDFRALFTELTPTQNLKLAYRRGGATPDEVFDLFPGLALRAKLRTGDLSGGEQQMLAVGRALVQAPKVLLIDEMTMGLAPIVVESLMPLIRKVADETGAAVVLVEQHVQLALEVADKAVVLVHGDVVSAGTSSEVKADAQELEAAYLGKSSAASA